MRRFGFTPRVDFMLFTSDVINVLSSFESANKAITNFCVALSSKFGVKFQDGVMVECMKSSDDVEREYRERGMI